MLTNWILFGLFLAYFVGYETWWGLRKYKAILTDISSGQKKKTQLYMRLMLGLWIPAGVVIILIITGYYRPGDLGLGWFQFHEHLFFRYSMAGLAILYGAYLLYTLIALRINAIKKVGLSQEIPDTVKALLPGTAVEKRAWILTALTAGITEELLFRGFLFGLLSVLFPGLSIFVILIITTVIFGIGHLYQGPAEAVKPMLLGLLFGLFYIAFGTILPCIVLHAMQDLCATEIIQEDTVREQR